jgi:hypothetical protein
MPKSYSSMLSGGNDDEEVDQLPDMGRQQDSQERSAQQPSPLLQRRTYSTRSLERRPPIPDESSSLLDNADGGIWGRSYRSIGPSTPGTPRFQRQHSYSTSSRFPRTFGRGDSYSFSQRLVNALSSQHQRRDTGLGASLFINTSLQSSRPC